MDITRGKFLSIVGLSGLGTFFVGPKIYAGLMSNPDLGRATLDGTDIDPGTPELDLLAKSKTTLYMTYIAGSTGIPVGGKLRISYSGINSSGCVNFQNYAPSRSNYVTVTTTGSCSISVEPIQEGCQICLYLTILDNPLQEGELIEIVFGDTSGGGAGYHVPSNAGRAVMPFFPNFFLFIYPCAFRVRVALDGMSFEDVENEGHLPIRVLPCPASSVLVAPRTNVMAGVPTHLTVMLHDEWGNCDHRFLGTVGLSCTDPAAQIPSSVQLTELDAGRITLTNVVFNTPGMHRVEAEVIGHDISSRSSVIICSEQETELKLLWGDLHVHTVVSDGFETMDKMFEFAREISGFDFMATSEHSWRNDDAVIIDAETNVQVDAAYEPGIFSTIKGFEWIDITENKIGHHNVYYRTTVPPVISHVSWPYAHWTMFLEELSNHDAIIIPHAPSKGIIGFIKKWQYHCVKQERLVEIYQKSGAFEYQGNPRIPYNQQEGHNVQDGLALGYKLGFVGGSDSHTTRPGARTDSDAGYRPGLTAIYAKSNTREEVWQALWDRRCYATTGFRIVLEFSINGEMMGREIPVKPGEPVEMYVKAIGFTDIDTVEIVKGSIGADLPFPVIHTAYVGSDTVEFSWTDSSPLSDCFYYMRVTQVDGEMAWSSPIWVSPSMRIQEIAKNASTGDVTIRWGCLPFRLYGVYFTDSMDSDWQLAQTDIPSDDSGTVEWIDDGTYTGVHPSNVTKRFYMVKADT